MRGLRCWGMEAMLPLRRHRTGPYEHDVRIVATQKPKSVHMGRRDGARSMRTTPREGHREVRAGLLTRSF